MTASNEHPEDWATLKLALADRAPELLVDLFDKPARRSRKEWRWGSHGSTAVYFGGKAGPTFHSYETERGGSLIDAIMFVHGLSSLDAADWARAWLGMDRRQSRRAAPATVRPPPINVDREEEQRIQAAQALWRAGRAIDGTAAERYLRARAIDRWPPECVRFIGAVDAARASGWGWWRWPAVMVAATDSASNARAVQLVALNDDGSAAPHFDNARRKLKISRGSMTGTAVRMPGDPNGPLLLCEGPETALSVWMACQAYGGFEVWGNLGSIAKAPLDSVRPDRRVIVCRDDDPRDAQSRQTLRRAIRQWKSEGRTVLEVAPWSLSRGDKTDFNDLLKADGVDAICRRLDEGLTPSADPSGDLPEIARRHLDQAVRGALDVLEKHPAAKDDPPPFHVIRATLGIGKTEAALIAIAEAIRRRRSVAYFVPDHTLTSELEGRAVRMLAKMGVVARVRIWRGRDRPSPSDPSRKMCESFAVAEAARLARLDVGKTVCRVCAHRDACAYLTQTADEADLWLIPTSMLWLPRPVNMRNVSLAVVDEAFALGGLVGLEGPPLPPLRVERAYIEALPQHGTGRPAATADLAAELVPLRRKLLAALEAHPNGPLERSALEVAGLTFYEALRAEELEARQLVHVDTREDMSRAEMMGAIKRAAGNPTFEKACMLWREVARLLNDAAGRPSGRAHVERPEGQGFQAVRLYGVNRRGKGWQSTPTLHIDATANMALVEARVPQASLRADISASSPFATVHQYVGRTFGKTSLTESANALKDAWVWCVHRATRAGGRWLVVTHKSAKETIRERFDVPAFIDLAHFGNVAGRDEWRGARGVIVLGRRSPQPAEVERIAGAITGRAVDPAGRWYPAANVTLRAKDGSTASVEADRHPDPLSEAVRYAACEAEIMQSIGRGRAVGRSQAKPLEIVILGNVPLPIELDTLGEWQPLGFDDAMMAEFGAVLSSAGDAAKIAGMERRAVEIARQRDAEKLRTRPSNYILDGNVRSFGVATYRRLGARGPAGEIRFDGRRIRHPARWLARHLDLPITLQSLHSPRRQLGGALCPITGIVTFGFAPTSYGECEFAEEGDD